MRDGAECAWSPSACEGCADAQPHHAADELLLLRLVACVRGVLGVLFLLLLLGLRVLAVLFGLRSSISAKNLECVTAALVCVFKVI